MVELSENIISEVEAAGIDASDIGIEIKKGKGLLNRRKVLEAFGVVRTEADHQAVMRVVYRHAGDNYDVSDSLTVKAPAS